MWKSHRTGRWGPVNQRKHRQDGASLRGRCSPEPLSPSPQSPLLSLPTRCSLWPGAWRGPSPAFSTVNAPPAAVTEGARGPRAQTESQRAWGQGGALGSGTSMVGSIFCTCIAGRAKWGPGHALPVSWVRNEKQQGLKGLVRAPLVGALVGWTRFHASQAAASHHSPAPVMPRVGEGRWGAERHPSEQVG